MVYGVGTLWAIYIIVVVGTFIILWLLLNMAQRYYPSIGFGSVFLLATILGAVALVIGTAGLDPIQLTGDDRTWLAVLFLIAFLLPLFALIYIVWKGEYKSCRPKCQDECIEPCNPCEKNYVKQIVHCDRDTGICQIKERTIYEGNNVTKIIYHKGKSPKHIINE